MSSIFGTLDFSLLAYLFFLAYHATSFSRKEKNKTSILIGQEELTILLIMNEALSLDQSYEDNQDKPPLL